MYRTLLIGVITFLLTRDTSGDLLTKGKFKRAEVISTLDVVPDSNNGNSTSLPPLEDLNQAENDLGSSNVSSVVDDLARVAAASTSGDEENLAKFKNETGDSDSGTEEQSKTLEEEDQDGKNETSGDTSSSELEPNSINVNRTGLSGRVLTNLKGVPEIKEADAGDKLAAQIDIDIVNPKGGMNAGAPSVEARLNKVDKLKVTKEDGPLNSAAPNRKGKDAIQVDIDFSQSNDARGTLKGRSGQANNIKEDATSSSVTTKTVTLNSKVTSDKTSNDGFFSRSKPKGRSGASEIRESTQMNPKGRRLPGESNVAIAVDLDVVEDANKASGRNFASKGGSNSRVQGVKNPAVAVDFEVVAENEGARKDNQPKKVWNVKGRGGSFAKPPVNVPSKGKVAVPVEIEEPSEDQRDLTAPQQRKAKPDALEVDVDIVQAKGKQTGQGSSGPLALGGGGKKDAVEVDIDLAVPGPRTLKKTTISNMALDVEADQSALNPQSKPAGRNLNADEKPKAIEVDVDFVSKDGQKIPANFDPKVKQIVLKDQIPVKPGKDGGLPAIEVDFDIASKDVAGESKGGSKSQVPGRGLPKPVSSSQTTRLATKLFVKTVTTKKMNVKGRKLITEKTKRPRGGSVKPKEIRTTRPKTRIKPSVAMKPPYEVTFRKTTKRFTSERARSKTSRSTLQGRRLSPTTAASSKSTTVSEIVTTEESVTEEEKSEIERFSPGLTTKKRRTTKKRPKKFKFRGRKRPNARSHNQDGSAGKSGGISFWVWGSIVAVVAMSLVVVAALSFSPIKRLRNEEVKPES